MNTEPAPATPTNGPDPLPDRPAAGAVPGPSAALLGLIHGLIAFGQALVRTLQAAPAAGTLFEITCRFGTRDLAVIIARITRGLMLASALEARVTAAAHQLDTPRPRPAAQTTSTRKRRLPVPPVSQQADDAALLARLPTAQEIAARVRGKPIGLVLEEICHDLGITCAHPLWRQLQNAMIRNGGNPARLFNAMQQRFRAGYVSPPDDLLGGPPHPFPAALSATPTGTGPP